MNWSLQIKLADESTRTIVQSVGHVVPTYGEGSRLLCEAVHDITIIACFKLTWIVNVTTSFLFIVTYFKNHTLKLTLQIPSACLGLY